MGWKSKAIVWYVARRVSEAAGLNRKERKEMSELIKKLLGLALGSSWVSTLLVWLAGITGAQYVDWTDPTTHAILWGKVIVAVLVFLLGRFLKDDARVHGGTVSVPSVPIFDKLPAKESMLTPGPK